MKHVYYELTQKQIRVWWCNERGEVEDQQFFPNTEDGTARADRCIQVKFAAGYAIVTQPKKVTP